MALNQTLDKLRKGIPSSSVEVYAAELKTYSSALQFGPTTLPEPGYSVTFLWDIVLDDGTHFPRGSQGFIRRDDRHVWWLWREGESWGPSGPWDRDEG